MQQPRPLQSREFLLGCGCFRDAAPFVESVGKPEVFIYVGLSPIVLKSCQYILVLFSLSDLWFFLLLDGREQTK